MFIAMTQNPDHDDVTLGGDAATAAATGGQKPDVDALAMAGFDKGIEQGTELHEPGVTKPDEEGEEEAPAATGGTDDGVDDEGKPIKPPAPKAKAPAAKAAPKAGEPPAGDGEQGEPEPDAEIEQEIAANGLKAKGAERFRELATFRKEAEPIVSALKELGIESVEHIEQLRTVAEDGVAFRQVMTQSAATEDQFARAFSYLGAVNSGDPAMMRQGFDAMFEEVKWLAEKLGIELPGAVDPLDADPALKKRVTDGEVPRDVALQAVAARRTTELTTERQTAQTAAQAAATAKSEALEAVKGIAAKLVEEEGLEVFQAKQVLLAPAIAAIQKNTPPAQWAAEIDKLFRATAAPAPKAKPAPSPIRPGGRAADTPPMVAKPKDEYDAFDMGLAAAKAQGYGG